MNELIQKTVILFAVICIIVTVLTGCRGNSTEHRLKEFAESAELNLQDWPKELVELLERNPETKDFVYSYPLEKDIEHTIDLSSYKNCNTVPHLLQWDKSWGYEQYGDGMIALTGCGPLCLAMVNIYVNNDTDTTPLDIARLAEDDGYYEKGYGSAWSLMTEGAELIDLRATEIPLDKNIIFNVLKAGTPIIASMGAGDFTESGHYIVLAGIENGKIKVNDPNSIIRSQKLWSYESLSGQIKNIWKYERVG